MRFNRLLFPCVLVLLIGCASSESQLRDTRVRGRKFKAWEATGYHQEIQLQIGWYPYEEGAATNLESDEWVITFADSGETDGRMPVILVTYPDSSRVLTLGMDIDDALLGKLLKHSLMTEIPIKRPFTDFLREADCATCHPPEIDIDD